MEEHTAAENNDCTIATKCTVCGHTMSEAKDAHTPNADGSKCEDCGTSLLTDTTDKITDTTPNTDTTKEKGCGSMISVAGLALVASLGACAIFIEKKRK